MKLHLIFAIFLSLIALNQCQHYPSTGQIDTTTSLTSDLDFGGIINGFLNHGPIKHKIQSILSIVDLKIRLIRLAKTIFTRENFILFRRLLQVITKISNFIIQFLPETSTESNTSTIDLLGSLLPSLNVNITGEHHHHHQPELPDKYGVPDQYGPPSISNAGSSFSNSGGSSTVKPLLTLNITHQIQEAPNDNGSLLGGNGAGIAGAATAAENDSNAARFYRSFPNLNRDDFNHLSKGAEEQALNLANLIYRTDNK